MLKEFDTLPLISVKSITSGGPQAFTLDQNYPNPFNPVTKINYTLRVPQIISLKVFDATGAEVATLDKGYKEEGVYNATFGGGNFARLVSGSYRRTIKMTLVK